jgi:hypothetical protein
MKKATKKVFKNVLEAFEFLVSGGMDSGLPSHGTVSDRGLAEFLANELPSSLETKMYKAVYDEDGEVLDEGFEDCESAFWVGMAIATDMYCFSKTGKNMETLEREKLIDFSEDRSEELYQKCVNFQAYL